jgi:lipopolysaccharide biosynthesis glycosyltransferase
MLKTIIISASDQNYVFLANDLFSSLKKLSFQHPFDIGLLDVGMDANNRKFFEEFGVRVATAEADIEYPAREQWEAKRPGVRTLTARPFLRRYFPGYDLYIWLDADVWVQTPEAIDTMISEAARIPAMFIACELDRCYTGFFENAETWLKFAGWYQTNFNPETAAAMTLKPMLNAGVFALHAASPVWDAWRDMYSEALQRTTGFNDQTFMADQLGLNILLYLKGQPFVTMPANFNWLTFFALPKLDRATNLLVEPLPPYRPISQIHLTRPQKNVVEKIQCTDGSWVERKLTFSGQNEA